MRKKVASPPQTGRSIWPRSNYKNGEKTYTQHYLPNKIGAIVATFEKYFHTRLRSSLTTPPFPSGFIGVTLAAWRQGPPKENNDNRQRNVSLLKKKKRAFVYTHLVLFLVIRKKKKTLLRLSSLIRGSWVIDRWASTIGMSLSVVSRITRSI